MVGLWHVCKELYEEKDINRNVTFGTEQLLLNCYLGVSNVSIGLLSK